MSDWLFPVSSQELYPCFQKAWRNTHRKILVFFPVMILNQLLTIMLPVSLGVLLEISFSYHSYRAQIFQTLPQNWVDSIPHFYIFFSSLLIIRTLTDWYSRYLRDSIGLETSNVLQQELFKQQLNIPLITYLDKGKGKYLLRWSSDLTSIQNWVSKGILQFFSDTVLFIGCILLISYWFPEMVYQIILSWLLCFLTIFLSGKYIFKKSSLKRNKRSRLLSYISQRLYTVEMIQVFNRQIPEYKRFNKLLEDNINSHKQYLLLRSFVYASTYFLFYGWVGYLLFEATFLPVEKKNLFIPATLVLLSLSPVFRRMFQTVVHWKNGNISLKKLEQVFKKGIDLNINRKQYSYQQGRLNIHNLKFKYPEKKNLFSNLSVDITGPGIYYIPMEPSTGKSTFIRLITGNLSISKNMIYWDRQDLNTLSPKSLRKRIAIVSNIYPISGRSVFEAISYSNHKDKKPIANNILQTIQSSLSTDQCLHIDDKVGEMGSMLSDMQKAILCYCRAFLTRKPILIIEKPWEYLNEETIEVIASKIISLREKHTIIFLDSSRSMSFYPSMLLDHITVIPPTSSVTTLSQ